MDRRQKKTREAIFKAFGELLEKKDFAHITVGEIIQRADVGRATFYSHFETKDFLLKSLCEELFCHIFDAADGDDNGHKHIFHCDPPSSVFLHLIQHLQKNDNNVLGLLASQNNELFIRYFKEGLRGLIKTNLDMFADKRAEGIPDDFWIDHICVNFVETIRWWVENGMKESANMLSFYFFATV